VEIPEFNEWIKKMSEAPELPIGTDNFKIFYEISVDKTKIEPNEQIHNFFEAYAFAINKLKKFQNLHEIEKTSTDILKKRGQNQVVYCIRSRLKNSPDFFEVRNFGTKGVYLIPKALKFKDIGGKYSPLIFDFDKGTVKMPDLLNIQDTEIGTEPNIGKERKEEGLAEPVKALSTTSQEMKPPKPLKVQVQETEISNKPPIGEERKEESLTEPIKTLSPTSKENGIKKHISRKSFLIFCLIVIIVTALVFQIFPDSNTKVLNENYIIYSIDNSNDDQGDFILFYLTNPDHIMINTSIILPTDVFRFFNGDDKGYFSSYNSYSNYSIIRWKTNEDSKMKIYINTFDKIPFELTLHNNSGRNVMLLGIDKFNQDKPDGNIQWKFEISRS